MTDSDLQLVDSTSPDLKALSFSRSEPSAIKAWLATLPMANLGSVTRSLYEAIDEINRLKAGSQQRFEILETLRESVLFAYNGLKRHYLHQPLNLPEQAKRVVNLSIALIGRYLDGYKLVIHQCQAKYEGFSLSKPNQLTSAAICRAMSLIQLNLIRGYQLYEENNPKDWSTLHKVYLIAQHLKLLHTDCARLLGNHEPTTAESMYIQLNLIGCIKANQLRQDDIEIVSQKVSKWASMVKLLSAKGNEHRDSLYLINPYSSAGPIYQKFHQAELSKQAYLMDTELLTEHLQALSSDKLNQSLKQHLLLAWGVFSERTFMRLESNDELDICLGLSSIHFFISEGMNFERLIYGDKDKREFTQSANEDAWSNAYDAQDNQTSYLDAESIDYHIHMEEEEAEQQEKDLSRYPKFTTNMINVSPGGYCLKWDQDSSHLKTGELIGIREKHHNQWSVGVIRWIQNNNRSEIRLGVQLLSPSAMPYGAKVINNKAKRSSDFMRVIVFPDISSIGQKQSLITPAISFKAGQRVELIQNGDISSLALQNQSSQSNCYYQFEFEETKKRISETSPKDQSVTDKPTESFDSLWDDL